MAEVRVWAPKAEMVELQTGSRRLGMTKENSGWWSADTDEIRHGADYGFLIDGEGPFPDPRSCWQPNGVHELSRWVDHSRFDWHDEGWQQPPLESALIYEMHVGTFTPEGTFDSAIEKLDHLIDLGVTHLELMPVTEFSGKRGWGYDGVDLYAVHDAYGGPEGLKRMVDACHQRDLAVSLDVVYNHFGPCGNYVIKFGPYLTDRYRTPWGDAVNLDGPDSDKVRRFFIDGALMWLRDYHMDGLRIDAVHAIVDTSAIHFLEQLAGEVKELEAKLGRHLILIAESDLNDSRVVRSPELGGYGIDAQWNEDFHHALHTVLTGESQGYYQDFGSLADLARVITKGLAYDGRYSQYRRRIHGRPAGELSGHQFISFLQNHDQIGNRAKGDRTSHLLTAGQLKIAATLVMTSPFVPLLFQGEEWAASTPFLYFTDYDEPGMGDAVTKGRQEEFAAFGWDPKEIPDPQDEKTFLRSTLNWDEVSERKHQDILEWYRLLVELRRKTSELTDGRFQAAEVEYDQAGQWLMMTRGSVMVGCNFGGEKVRIPCSNVGRKSIILSSRDGIATENDAILLPGEAVVVLEG
jgi:maltooligosyltrehalose trehalohydrolase